MEDGSPSDKERQAMAEWQANTDKTDGETLSETPQESAPQPQPDAAEHVQNVIQNLQSEKKQPDAENTSADEKKKPSFTEVRQRASDTLGDLRQRATDTLGSVQVPEGLKNARDKGAEVLNIIKEKGLEGIIDDLKAKAQAELKNEKEATEYNAVLAKVIAKDAGQKLWDKLKHVEPGHAFAFVVFASLALLHGQGIAMRAQELTPEGGNIINGLSNYLDSLGDFKSIPLFNLPAFTGAAIFMGAALASETKRKIARASSEEPSAG